MLDGQPGQVLAPIHAAVAGGLIDQWLKLEGDTNRNTFSSADLAWVVFWFPGHKELAIIFLITLRHK
jgi:hypothetical protein